MCNKDKLKSYFHRINWSYVHAIAVLLTALCYILATEQPAYTENLRLSIMEKIFPDVCQMEKWSETYDPTLPIHRHDLDTCMNLGKVNKLGILALAQFMAIQGRRYPSAGLISSCSFGTNANVISLLRRGLLKSRRDIMIHPRRATAKPKEQATVITCQNNIGNEGNGNPFTIRVPITVTYLNEEFKETTEDFIGSEACLLWHYFSL